METPDKTIICTVTNDLNQDQRMHRICGYLSTLHYSVILVGRNKKKSLPLLYMPFEQKRLRCFFEKGFLFYAEYNIRLFLFLLKTKKADIIYTVDDDTLLAGGLIRLIKNTKQIFDAHEYFTETPELAGRTIVKSVWALIEKIFIPRADAHITVNESLANLFSQRYGKKFVAIFNAPKRSDMGQDVQKNNSPILLYQGMLNAGRGLETLIDAMLLMPGIHLRLVGEGDLSESLRDRASQSSARDRIHFAGWKSADEMKILTKEASLGINLLSGASQSYFYSLSNKFFDYMHAGVPSVNMDFPEYRQIISAYEVGILIHELSPEAVATGILHVIRDTDKIAAMRISCYKACREYCWENETVKLRQVMEGL